VPLCQNGRAETVWQGFCMEKLKTETISVSEIALSSGFTDIPHFTKIFKKYVGKTPSEYRSSV
jgi:AraC-like DNA-binding protein